MTKSRQPKEVGNKRLLALAEFLEKLPRKRFSLDRWATTIPSLRRAGLRLKPYAHPDNLNTPLANSRIALAGDQVDGTHEQGYVAAATIFSIDYQDSRNLFDPGRYLHFRATPKQVAKHIRKFVRDRRAQ